MAQHYLSDRDYQKMMNSPDVQRVLDRVADAIVAAARSKVKKVTGRTSDSLVKENAIREDGVKVRRVGYDLDIYEGGPYEEFGTEDTAPHPVLRAAGRAGKKGL